MSKRWGSPEVWRERPLAWSVSRPSASAWPGHSGRWSVSLERNAERGDLLVVDDNRVNRLLVTRTLEQFGHRVAFAENGRLGLEMLRNRPAELVLLDIEMPEMNGYQMLQALRADSKLRDIPVVMMSSVDEVDSVAR